MSVEDKFNAFHKENPHVYFLFKAFAYEAFRAGATKISSKLIIERIRWETTVTTSGSGWYVAKGKKYLIDNRFTAHYSRLFIKDFPKLAGRFELRAIKTP